MPELPEVTTIVTELNRFVRGKIIKDIWSDSPKLLRPLSVPQFRRRVRGKKFLGFRRRAKFIISRLGNGSEKFEVGDGKMRRSHIQSHTSHILLWHMGMTGHPLFRNPKLEARNSKRAIAMKDPMNQHVRLIFYFTDGTRLEYADIRKFGKAELLTPEDAEKHVQLMKLGPEALEIAENPEALRKRIQRRKTAMKVVLLDQTVLAGIGNIYADEALWTARIHPLQSTNRLTSLQSRVLARAIRQVLRTAIRVQGSSIDDFRRTTGEKGGYGNLVKAYQRNGLPCFRCGTIMKRIVVGGRGTHFCARCQRL